MDHLTRFLRPISVEEALLAVAITLGVFLLLYFLRRVLVNRIQRWAKTTSTTWDDKLAVLIDATHGISLFFLSAYIATRTLPLTNRAEGLLDKAMIIVFMMQFGIWGNRWIRTWVRERTSQGDGEVNTRLGVVAFVLTFVLWVIVVLVTLNNLGFDITALVASLGVGGVAVALAVQNILGDLFASLSIAFDKPFLVGDFIIIDDMMGTVKNVGLKTTRIQSLGGEELVFANNDLLKSRIRNYRQMAERRISFGFGLNYATPLEKLSVLPSVVADVVKSQPKVRLDRAHFKSLERYSLDFEVVYYVLTPDFAFYMDTQQNINLALMRKFKEMGVEFAYPTQTLHVHSAEPSDRKKQEDTPPAVVTASA